MCDTYLPAWEFQVRRFKYKGLCIFLILFPAYTKIHTENLANGIFTLIYIEGLFQCSHSDGHICVKSHRRQQTLIIHTGRDVTGNLKAFKTVQFIQYVLGIAVDLSI